VESVEEHLHITVSSEWVRRSDLIWIAWHLPAAATAELEIQLSSQLCVVRECQRYGGQGQWEA